LVPAVIQKRLQHERGSHLVHYPAVFLPWVARLIEDLVGFVGGQPFVPKMNRQTGQRAQLGGEGLGSGYLGAVFAGKMHWIAHHDSGNPEAAAEAGQRAQILSGDAGGATAALKREHRLRGQAQFVGHSNANATVAYVESEVTQWFSGVQGVDPCY
jgi:hypothetical protein